MKETKKNQQPVKEETKNANNGPSETCGCHTCSKFEEYCKAGNGGRNHRTFKSLEELQGSAGKAGNILFCELNYHHKKITGKEIGIQTFDDCRQDEINDAMEKAPYKMVGDKRYLDEDWMEEKKAEIMENFDMESAHRREGNLCGSVIYCEDYDFNKNFVYIYNKTWYRLAGPEEK